MAALTAPTLDDILEQENMEPDLEDTSHMNFVDGRCSCCPYGYHIDLDFLRYCDSLNNGSYLRHLKKIKRKKRQLRKSMEIYLDQQQRAMEYDTGGPPPDLVNSTENYVNVMEYQEDSATNQILDEIDSSVNATLSSIDVLMQQKKGGGGGGTSYEHQEQYSPDRHGPPLSPDARYRQELNVQLLGSAPLRKSDSINSLSSQSSVATEQSTSSSFQSSTSITMLTAHHHSGLTSAQLAANMNQCFPYPDGSGMSGTATPSQMANISQSQLQAIREQMALSLNRMRELEEQVKAIPVLQVRISVLKEEKRLLMLQLKAKSNKLNMRSIGVGESRIDDMDHRPRSRSPSGSSFEITEFASYRRNNRHLFQNGGSASPEPKPVMRSTATGDGNVFESAEGGSLMHLQSGGITKEILSAQLSHIHEKEIQKIVLEAQQELAYRGVADGRTTPQVPEKKVSTRTIGIGSNNVFEPDSNLHVHQKELRTVLIGGSGPEKSHRNVGIQVKPPTRDVGVRYVCEDEKPMTRSVAVGMGEIGTDVKDNLRGGAITTTEWNAMSLHEQTQIIQDVSNLNARNININTADMTTAITDLLRRNVRSVATQCRFATVDVGVNHEGYNMVDANVGDDRIDVDIRDKVETRSIGIEHRPQMTNRWAATDRLFTSDVMTNTQQAIPVHKSTNTINVAKYPAATNTEQPLSLNIGTATDLKMFMQTGVMRSTGVNTKATDTIETGMNTESDKVLTNENFDFEITFQDQNTSTDAFFNVIDRGVNTEKPRTVSSSSNTDRSRFVSVAAGEHRVDKVDCDKCDNKPRVRSIAVGGQVHNTISTGVMVDMSAFRWSRLAQTDLCAKDINKMNDSVVSLQQSLQESEEKLVTFERQFREQRAIAKQSQESVVETQYRLKQMEAELAEQQGNSSHSKEETLMFQHRITELETLLENQYEVAREAQQTSEETQQRVREVEIQFEKERQIAIDAQEKLMVMQEQMASMETDMERQQTLAAEAQARMLSQKAEAQAKMLSQQTEVHQKTTLLAEAQAKMLSQQTDFERQQTLAAEAQAKMLSQQADLKRQQTLAAETQAKMLSQQTDFERQQTLAAEAQAKMLSQQTEVHQESAVVSSTTSSAPPLPPKQSPTPKTEVFFSEGPGGGRKMRVVKHIETTYIGGKPVKSNTEVVLDKERSQTSSSQSSQAVTSSQSSESESKTKVVEEWSGGFQQVALSKGGANKTYSEEHVIKIAASKPEESSKKSEYIMQVGAGGAGKSKEHAVTYDIGSPVEGSTSVSGAASVEGGGLDGGEGMHRTHHIIRLSGAGAGDSGVVGSMGSTSKSTVREERITLTKNGGVTQNLGNFSEVERPLGAGQISVSPSPGVKSGSSSTTVVTSGPRAGLGGSSMSTVTEKTVTRRVGGSSMSTVTEKTVTQGGSSSSSVTSQVSGQSGSGQVTGQSGSSSMSMTSGQRGAPSVAVKSGESGGGQIISSSVSTTSSAVSSGGQLALSPTGASSSSSTTSQEHVIKVQKGGATGDGDLNTASLGALATQASSSSDQGGTHTTTTEEICEDGSRRIRITRTVISKTSTSSSTEKTGDINGSGELRSIMKTAKAKHPKKKGISFAENVLGGYASSSSDDDESGAGSDSDGSHSSTSYDEGSYDGRQGNITYSCKDDEAIAQGAPGARMFDQNIRETFELQPDVGSACKVYADFLQDSAKVKSKELNSAINVIQQEWFKVSSHKLSNPHQVEDFLTSINELSKPLMEKVINLSDANGNTALHYAVSHCNMDIVSLLLDAGACDVNKQNKAGYTAIMLASLAVLQTETQRDVISNLFKSGDVNARASQAGQTALMLAVSHGRGDMVKLLQDAGANVNAQDEDGSTALMCASEHGHTDIVKLLLANPDINANLTDNDGSTALSIAMEAGHKDIGVLLYAHLNFSKTASSPEIRRKMAQMKF